MRSNKLVDLLTAIQEGRVTRTDDGRGYFAGYLLDGTEIDRLTLRWFARQWLILMPMVGPPTITLDGVTWLKQQRGTGEPTGQP